MASPRTRRLLQELKPTNENDVSKIKLFFLKIYVVLLHFRNVLNAKVITHNGHRLHMVYGYV